MNIIKYGLIIFIAIISLNLNAADRNEKNLNSSAYFEEGERELKAKNYAKAAKAFRIVQQFNLFEGSSLTEEKLAQLKLHFVNKMEENEAAFKNEIHAAYLMKGLALVKNDKYEEAMIQFDVALNHKPDYAEAYLAKGNIFAYKKDYKEALRMYDLALKYKPNYRESYISKGILYADHLKNYKESITLYDLAINCNPKNPEAYLLKAVSLDKLGRGEEAKFLRKKAEDLRNMQRQSILDNFN